MLDFKRWHQTYREPKLVLLPPVLILDPSPVEKRKEGRREGKAVPKEEETEKVTVVAVPPW